MTDGGSLLPRMRRKRERYVTWLKEQQARVWLNVGIVVGWISISGAIYVAFGHGREVLLLSFGLLVWGYVGYGYLAHLFFTGLYALSKAPKDSSPRGGR